MLGVGGLSAVESEYAEAKTDGSRRQIHNPVLMFYKDMINM